MRMDDAVMKRKMLVRNISYMKKELLEMEKELAMMDSKAEPRELMEFKSESLNPQPIDEQK